MLRGCFEKGNSRVGRNWQAPFPWRCDCEASCIENLCTTIRIYTYDLTARDAWRETWGQNYIGFASLAPIF